MNTDINVLDFYSEVNKPPIVSNKYKGLKVTALQADSSACGHYRIIHPLHYLNMHGADCKWIQIASLDLLMDSDIVIAQRQYDKSVLENMLLEAKKYGKCVIYECDDNLFAVLPGSPVYGIYHQGTEQLKNVGKILNSCDGATVSTVELAGDYYCLNNNIEVLKNSIDFAIRDWKTVPEDRDPNHLIVGWSGGKL